MNVLNDKQNTIFTLVYAEREIVGKSLSSITGPTLHTTRQDCIEELWQYVKVRIAEACKEEFVENSVELGITPPSLESATSESIDLSSIKDNKKEQVINWYFNFMDDDICECFFKIDEHSVKHENIDIRNKSLNIDLCASSVV